MGFAQERDVGGIVYRMDRVEPEIACRLARPQRFQHGLEARGTFGVIHPAAIMQFAQRRVAELCRVGEMPHVAAALASRARASLSPISGSSSPMSGPWSMPVSA